MKYIAMVGLLLLAACDTPEPTTKPIVIQSQPIQRPALTLPPVDPFRARDVEWVVITPENADEVFQRMQAQGQAPALFGVAERGYENISINTAESLRVILQQQAVIDGYREYYLRVDRNLAQHNSTLNQ